ncbi:hypothetical protein JKF63_00529 [Porcisia hertigi]|uniref:RRM domain-containing protein n=1 Tax=Porcisia hertigi TaxID=2761500 RepID=A0A836HDA0_9TRYP|nr:hypothetical protein JKF63_00529 [Porcisia hertigi]
MSTQWANSVTRCSNRAFDPPQAFTTAPATSRAKVSPSGKPFPHDEGEGSSLDTASTARTRETSSSSSSKQSAPLTAASPTACIVESLLNSGVVSHRMNDGGNIGDAVQVKQHARLSPRSGASIRRRQESSPASPPAASSLPLAPPAHDSTAPESYIPMGSRRAHAHGHGRSHREGGGGGGSSSSRPNAGIGISGAEDVEDQASIRSEQSGQARQADRGTPGVTSLSTDTLSSQQQQQQQQQRPGKCHSSSQTESSFSSSQIGSLSLNCGDATPRIAVGGSGGGGHGGGRHRRSTSVAGGEGGSPSYSRHLQPPTNHSHVNLFVRDLPLELNEDKLRALFSPFGDIVNSAIMRNIHTGVSLGTAFVRFAKHEEAMRAMEAFAGGRAVTGSRRVTVQWARREHDKAPSGDERRKMRKLFIRNVPKDVTQEMLVALFIQFGPVKSVSTHRDTAAANAVSQPSGGGVSGATEADPTSQAGHESAVAGSSIEDRRIAFVTFELEGVAEQATAAVHNTMPFPSCQGIPLMVKLAEDTPVRGNALVATSNSNSSNTRANNVSANENGAHPPRQGSVGAHHPVIILNIPSSHTPAWSDLPRSDSLATPSASLPAAQLHSSSAIAMSPSVARDALLTWNGALGLGASRSPSHVPQDSSVAPALSPPHFFTGTVWPAASPNSSPPYTALTSMQGNSLMLTYPGRSAGSTHAPRQPPPHGLTTLLAPPTSASATTMIPQHLRSGSVVDARRNFPQTLDSRGCVSASSGSYNVQVLSSGLADLIGVAGSEYVASLPAPLYDAQELYAMLQQYGSSLPLASGASAFSFLPGGSSVLVQGAGDQAHADCANNNTASTSVFAYQTLGDYSDAVQCGDMARSPPLPPLQAPTTEPPSVLSFQQLQSKALTLPQPRSSATQQSQPAQGELDGSCNLDGGQTPVLFQILPQPRSHVNTSTTASPSRSSTGATLSPFSTTCRRANAVPSDDCPLSFSVTPQNHVSRLSPPNLGASFASGSGGMDPRNKKACSRGVAVEAEGGRVIGALTLRHGPRATSSSTHHAILSEASDVRGSSGCVGSAGTATGPLRAVVNAELAVSSASNSTGSVKPFQVTGGIHGSSSATCHNVRSRMNPRGSSTVKRTTNPTTQWARLPVLSGHPPTPQPSSQRSYSEQAQSAAAEVVPSTFTTAPLMAAVAQIFPTDDASLPAGDLTSFNNGRYVSEDICAAKPNYRTLHAGEVAHTMSDGGTPFCSAASNSFCNNHNRNADVNKHSDSATGLMRPHYDAAVPATIDTTGDAFSPFRRGTQSADGKPHSVSLGGVGPLDDCVVLQWNIPSAEMSVASGITGVSSVAGTADQTVLPVTDAGRPKELTKLFELMAMRSQSHAQHSTAFADTPTGSSLSNNSSQPDASAYWGAEQFRNPSGVALGGGGDTVAAAYRALSATPSTPKDLSRRRGSRALPGAIAPPVMHFTPSDDDDDDGQACWGVHSNFNFDLGGLLGPVVESKRGGGVGDSRGDSGSSHDGVNHVRHTQQLCSEMDNLYSFISYDDASY